MFVIHKMTWRPGAGDVLLVPLGFCVGQRERFVVARAGGGG